MKQKLLAMMFALFAVQATVWAQETSGYCGDPNVNEGKDVTWELVDSTLIISGTGEMKKHTTMMMNKVPWKVFRDVIKKVVIEHGVTNITNYAFNGCTRLTTVAIPNSVTSIGRWAFYGCTSLTAVTIPNSVTSIGDDIFEGCSPSLNVTVERTNIKYSDFPDFYGFKITIGSSVESIGGGAFRGATHIMVDENNAIYDSRDNCNAIIEKATNKLITGCCNTVIPNSVTSISGGAFGSLGTVTCLNPAPPALDGNPFTKSDTVLLKVPDVDIYMDSEWIQYVSMFMDIDTERIVGFGYCGDPDVNEGKDASWYYDDGKLSISGKGTIVSCEMWKKYIISVVINEGITGLGCGAFDECKALTEITIPKSVTRIATSSFELEAEAFKHCSSLAVVTCLNPVPPALGMWALRHSRTAILRVPDVEAYKASDWRSRFDTIVDLSYDGISEVETGRNDAPIIIYDLSGRRVTNPVKGQIYIVNGKAVVM